jgi:hypothetical protein
MTAGYAFFAERYHWCPAQVDALPHWFSARLPEYASMVDEIREKKSKK